MNKDPLAMLGSRFATILGLVLAVAGGLAYGTYWLVVLLLIVGAFVASTCAWTWYREARESQAALSKEKRQHATTKAQAEHAASQALESIRTFLRRYSLGYAAETIRRSVQYMNRMCRAHEAWGGSPSVIRFTKTHGLLFVTVEMPEDALTRLREEDALVLVQVGTDGIRNKVAMLRVNQRPDIKKRSLFLRVDTSFNDGITGLLSSLAELPDQRPRGFIVELPFPPEPFLRHDLAKADSLFATMGEHLNEIYLEEVVNV
jgi:hypothetical protein